MRRVIFASILILSGASPTVVAQPGPRYNVDSARSFSPGCDSLPVYAYFQVHAKYPESPATLKRWANNALDGYRGPDGLDGHITFRVLIDCAGHLAAVKLLQVDARYEHYYFPKGLVDRLYAFLLSLNAWEKASVDGRPVNYCAFLSFKIENGDVAQISP